MRSKKGWFISKERSKETWKHPSGRLYDVYFSPLSDWGMMFPVSDVSDYLGDVSRISLLKHGYKLVKGK